jgi:NAD(P)H-nitrite reductase large subunit
MLEKNAKIMICRCEDITREDILACIADGYETLDEIKRVTRAGMGPCQGRTCRSLIANELTRAYDEKMEDILIPTFRPPVKPVSLGALADAFEKQHFCENNAAQEY